MGVPDAVKTFCRRLPLDGGQLHVLCPAGIGDNTWLWSKWASVCEERQVTFWMPAAEQQRSHAYFAMVGAKSGYMQGLTTRDVWALPPSPEIPDVGAVLTVHPNGHLERGMRLDKWYGEFPFRNPCPDPNAAVYRLEAGTPKYVAVFMCQRLYPGGNLLPGTWARILREIEHNVAPVVLVGADEDVRFISQVCECFDPTATPLTNAPLEHVLKVIKSAFAFVGVASGLSVLSAYSGVPTVHLYSRMSLLYPDSPNMLAGTWEEEGSPSEWCFLDDAPYDAMNKLTGVLNARN